MNNLINMALGTHEASYTKFAEGVASLFETGSYRTEDVSDEYLAKMWKRIVQLAMKAGVREEDFQIELGASPSTLHRWLAEGKCPRRSTQIPFIAAMAECIRSRIEARKLEDDSS